MCFLESFDGPGFNEKSLSEIGLNGKGGGVGKVVPVLSYGAAFMVELANVVLMLADSLFVSPMYATGQFAQGIL